MTAALLLGLMLISVLFHVRLLTFDFVNFDDHTVLLGHPELYDQSRFADGLRQIFLEYFPREEPLPIRDLSWAIDARLFGFENPLGYHLGNVLLHAAVVALLFLFLRRTLRDERLAALIALAFAVLPIHVEPVAWIMGRKDLLVAFFMLAALLSQSIELGATQRRHRIVAYVASLLFTLLALGSKISAISLFLLLAAHRVFQPDLEGREAEERPGKANERKAFWRSRGRSLPYLLPHALLSVGVFLAYRRVLADFGVLETNAPTPLSAEHLMNVVQFFPLVLGEYLHHLFWGQDLSAYYRWPHVAIPLETSHRIAGAVLAAAICVGVVHLFRKRRDRVFFALLPLILLIPYTGLFYVGFWQADRYVYLAVAGPLVLAALLLRDATRMLPPVRPLTVGVGIAFIATSAAGNWQQQSVWKDSESLWSYESRREEPSILALQGLAKIHVQRAEQASGQEERFAEAARALALIDQGFLRRAELGLIDSPYWLPETAQEARLHLLKGRVARLLGAPSREQIVHFRNAFDLAPDRVNALLLSGSLFQTAAAAGSSERDALLEESLDVFEAYVELSTRDPHELEESRILLERNYAQRFPQLTGRVARIRSTYYP